MTSFDGELLEWESNIRVTMNGDNKLLETVQQQEWSSKAVLEKKRHATGAPSPIHKRALIAI